MSGLSESPRSAPGGATSADSFIDRHAPQAPLAVLIASVATLGIALISQYGFGLQPCILCIWQRWPYVATSVIALLALALVRSPRLQGILVIAACIVFLFGAGIAAFHVGVEQHWWAGTAECVGGGGADTVDALRQQLAGKPIVRCDEAQFRLLGVSMAGWNFLASLFYAMSSLVFGHALTRRAA